MIKIIRKLFSYHSFFKIYFFFYKEKILRNIKLKKNKVKLIYLLKKIGKKPVQLNIGSGNQKLENYINIDLYNKKADIMASSKFLPFEDNTVDAIYTSHTIEHISPNDFHSSLIEWHRVLKSDGKISILTPNFEVYLKEWLNGSEDYKQGWGITNVLGIQDRGPGYLNRNGFSVQGLKFILENAGFKTTICKPGATRPEYNNTFEYRKNGDIHYVGLKQKKTKVLYVDAFSQLQAKANTHSLLNAYQKDDNLIVNSFDYRKSSKQHGVHIMNQLFVDLCFQFKPDIIHLGKCESILGSSIKKIKQELNHCIIFHYYGDMRPETRPHVLELGKYVDLTLFVHKDQKLNSQYTKEGLDLNKIKFWWPGVNTEVFKPSKLHQNKIYDVVFIGNNADFLPGHIKRRELIKKIASSGVQIHIFGKNWEIFKDIQNIFLHDQVFEHDFAKVCSQAKITIEQNTVDNVYFYNSWRRPFCCMSSGAFHLTSYFPGLDEVFINNKHLVWYDSFDDAIKKIKYYLNNDAEREQIALQGMAEVKENHTWDKRIKMIINYFSEVNDRLKQ